MNVSLTKSLNAYVAGKLAGGTYTGASEVIREALRFLQAHEESDLEIDGLEEKLLAGVRSPSRPVNAAYWRDLDRRLNRPAKSRAA